MKARRALSALAALLPALLAGPDAHASRTTAAAPGAVVLSFYRAYVARFRSDHDPLLDLALQGSPMVSASLLADLRTRLDDDADPDDDYFLHSPNGVRPCHGVAVELLHATSDAAAVRVTLGAPRTPPWCLSVALAKDAGAWRIRAVARDRAPPARKAAARAMSDC